MSSLDLDRILCKLLALVYDETRDPALMPSLEIDFVSYTYILSQFISILVHFLCTFFSEHIELSGSYFTTGVSEIATGNQVTDEKHKKTTGSHGIPPMFMTNISKGICHLMYVLGYHGYCSNRHRIKEILKPFSFFQYPWVLNLI
mmetsp:Transcript_24720/g.35270  ORF Transcript_24720/g.35270 Transcript_24720/m.35270 type:complete len:145 (+) Transcript_24720:2711-3145(+)